MNISDFEVKQVIGRGHFGEVQVVREKQSGHVYAMKTIRKSDTLHEPTVSTIFQNLGTTVEERLTKKMNRSPDGGHT